MDMNKIFFRTKEDCLATKKWLVIDAKGKPLGRLATEVATLLMGKNKADYAPHSDNGAYVVVLNAKDVVLTGSKLTDKIYIRVSGWIGGKKEISAKQMVEKDPTSIIHIAVRGMMPKNSLSSLCLTRLKVYVDDKHPHQGQMS